MTAAAQAVTLSLLPVLPLALGADATLELTPSTSDIDWERRPPCLCCDTDCAL
jgi:hypothetical protein